MPTDRGLLGHSYGGLFAIYALERQIQLDSARALALPKISNR
jgi:hypothetical protein